MAYLDLGGLTRFFAGIKQQFVSKSAIHNDLDATEEGSVLDARQGKVLGERMDAVEAGKAQAKRFVATFSSAGWSSTAPFTQTVSVTGASAMMAPIADVILSETMNTAQNELEAWGLVGQLIAGDGTLTASCYDAKPKTNVTVQLLNIE